MADQDKLREFPLLIRIKDQSGGVNTRSFATEIANNEAQEMNDLFSDPGLTRKRGGTTTFATLASGTSGAIRGSLNFNPDDGSGNVLLFNIEDKIFSINSSGTPSVRATGLTADLQGSFLQGLNKAYFSNGTDDPIVFDTALTLSTIASGSTAMQRHTTSDYLLNIIVTNDVNNPSFLHFSPALEDTMSIPTRTLKLGQGSGESEIVKVKKYRNRELIVFMNNRIEEVVIGSDLTDVTTWDIKVIDNRYGIGAKDTVQEIGGILYFFDNERNVRALSRTALDAPTGTQAIPISDKIESELDRVNRLHISKASAGVNENFYMLSLPLDDATENSHVFVLDTRDVSWYGPWNLNCAKFVESSIRGQGARYIFWSYC